MLLVVWVLMVIGAVYAVGKPGGTGGAVGKPGGTGGAGGAGGAGRLANVQPANQRELDAVMKADADRTVILWPHVKKTHQFVGFQSANDVKFVTSATLSIRQR